MFYEWVAHGAEIGVTAFAALAVFGMICLAVYGLFMVLVRTAGGQERRGRYAKGRRGERGRAGA